MFICPDKKFVFVSFTKSGSSSVYKILVDNFKGIRIGRNKKKIQDPYKDFTSFCVVRNPYSRMVSWWWAICKVKGDGYGHKKELADRGLTESLEDFLTLWDEKGRYEQVQGSLVNRMDHVIKVENIEEGFNALPFITEHIAIPRLHHKKSKPPTMELISPTAGKMINEMYANDFKMFDYKMETII